MILEERKNRIESLLRSAGFERLLPVEYQSSINDVELWTGTLDTPSSNAEYQVRAYFFDEQSGLVVDYEEDKNTLSAGRTQTSAWSHAPVLLHSGRTKDTGVLLTCRGIDESVFLQAPPSPTQSGYSYHRQLDRVIGWDYFRDFQGHPTKVYVTSIKRAEHLHRTLGELNEACRHGSDSDKHDFGFPAVLAVLQISNELLVGDAPEEYRDLAMVVTVIEGSEVLYGHPLPDASMRQRCIAQLFLAMRVAHRNRFTLSRAGGTNYVPRFVTQVGALNDAYYVWRDPDLKQAEQLWESQETDLINGLLTVCNFESELQAGQNVMLEALKSYMKPDPVRDDLVELVFQPSIPANDFLQHAKRVAASVLAMTADF